MLESPDHPLISADELREALESPTPPVVLDVRSGDDGRAAFLAGHIPAARYVDLRTDLSGPGGPEEGRTPLPSAAALQESMRGWGISAATGVVVYDGGSGLSAARAWWLLRWAGHARVRLLDAGLTAWADAGGELVTDLITPARGDVVVRPGSLRTLTAADVVALPSTGVLVDARDAARYSGETEPLDPVAGHIPGAISLPTTANLGPDGRFLHPDALRARFQAGGLLGRDPIAVYCGSGVTAAHEILALQVAGLEAAMYPPSWSGWITDPAHPVETGSGPLTVSSRVAGPLVS
jgi:thiosulfate/3-mercaptopyruvate sulfurtransferase